MYLQIVIMHKNRTAIDNIDGLGIFSIHCWPISVSIIVKALLALFIEVCDLSTWFIFISKQYIDCYFYKKLFVIDLKKQKGTN